MRHLLLAFCGLVAIVLRAQTPIPDAARRVFCPSLGISPPTPPVDLIVDDSKSMAGFVRTENRDVYGHVIENLLGRPATVRVRRMSRLHQIEPPSAVFEESFYSASNTPLETAFHMARDDRRGRIFIIISDLAQPRSSPGATARVFAEAMQTKKGILIVGFRSAYSTQEKPPCHSDCISTGRPPVFVIVLGSTSQIVRNFEEQVRIRASSVRGDESPFYFYGDGPAVDVDYINFAPERTRTSWRIDGTTNVACGAESIPTPVVFISGRGRQTVRASVTLHPLMHGSVLDLTAAEPDICFVDERDNIEQRSPSTNVRSEYESLIPLYNPQPIPLVYVLDPPERGRRAYRIRFKPVMGGVSVPVWVTNWSSESTVYKPQQNRCILKEIVEKILADRSIEQRPMLEHFVIIESQ